MKRLRKLAALPLLCTTTLYAAPSPGLPGNFTEKATTSSYQLNRAPVNRLIMFGDSISEPGNVNLLLKTLKGDENAELIFKPVNEDQVFLKWLHYMNMPLPDVKIIEEGVADLFRGILNTFENIPVYPDHYYYPRQPNNDHEKSIYHRFTNGPNWSEWFGQMVLSSDVSNKERYINRCYGGSWVSRLGDEHIDWTLDFSELKKSIIEYIDGKLMPPNMHHILTAFMMEYPKTAGGELIVTIYGGNDYMNNDYTRPPGKSNPRAEPETVVKDLIAELTRIADWAASSPSGSPPSQLIVGNIPDMSLTPRYQSGARKPEAAAFKQDIQTHNQLLKKQLASLQNNPAYHQKIRIQLVDVEGIFNKIYEESTAQYKTRACYPSDMLKSSAMLANARRIQAEKITPCPEDEQDKYMFWDQVHPARIPFAQFAYHFCKEVEGNISGIQCMMPEATDSSTYPDTALNP